MPSIREFPSIIPLDSHLSLFIGALLGDGFLGTRSDQVQITGDAELDESYFRNVLAPICRQYFSYDPSIKISDTVIRLRVYSKQLKYFLHEEYEIPIGVKCYTVQIPSKILSSENKCKRACLRGLFDTDGGVMFDRRKTYKKPYVRINYVSVSKSLVDQISDILLEFNLAHGVSERKNPSAWRIQINGDRNVKRFLSEVGFSNPRHLSKLRYLFP